MKHTEPAIARQSFSKEEIKLFEKYRDNQEDYRLKRRFIIFILIAKGTPIDNVRESFKVSPKTLDNWLNKYLAEGIDGLNSFNSKKKRRS
jgi:transposase